MLLLFTSLALGGDFQIGQQSIAHSVLPNGLDMIWIDDGQPRIDIYTVYAAGKYMETQPSLAHMTEHAMFCAKSGAFDKILQPHVKATNAYTRNEHTTYYSTDVPLESLPVVLSQEYQRMDGLDAKEACFAYEKGRLEKEEKENVNLLSDWELKRNRLLFGEGYGGDTATKKELTLAAVQDFYDRWYQPNRAAMVFVGALGENNWLEIQEIFSRLSNREAQRIALADEEPAQETFRYPLSKERRDWLWRGPSIAEEEAWLYWTVIAKAHQLTRDSDGLTLSFDGSMMASFIELSATGEDGEARLSELYGRIESGEIGAKPLQYARRSFSRQLEELPIRGRPYFSVASYLGFWAAWDRLPTLLRMLDTAQELSEKPTKSMLSYIDPKQRIEIFNPKGEVGALPDDPKELSVAAELAQNSGDISRAIACYERLLTLNPNKINAVIYHYYLGHLYLESGDKEQAKDYLLKGLAIVEYPALRELLEEIDQDIPHERAEAEVERAQTETGTERLRFEGEVPAWAAKAQAVMARLEEWRGLQFKEKVVIRFQEDAGYDAAGWYDHKTKALVVGKGGSERFGEGVMLHELYHALQDQSFDLGAIEEGIQTEDHKRAFLAVVEGEAMLAVSELMSYDFLSHVRYKADMSDERFQKNFNYGEGMKFVKAVREQGGWDAVSRLYTNGPRSTAAILNPARYLSGEDALQSLSRSVRVKGGETLISAESKGAYGWMRFLSESAPEEISELVPLYKADQHIMVERAGTVTRRWTVEFVSARAAQKVQEPLKKGKRAMRRRGRFITWEL